MIGGKPNHLVNHHFYEIAAFFAGPAVNPIVWSVLFGKNPSRIIYTENAGYGYLFFKTMENGFHGKRLELKAIRNVLYR
jgi:hypothetical protein